MIPQQSNDRPTMIPRQLKLAAGMLAAAAALIAHFPEQKGKVTVLKLVSGRVASVNYWSPGEQNPDDFLK